MDADRQAGGGSPALEGLDAGRCGAIREAPARRGGDNDDLDALVRRGLLLGRSRRSREQRVEEWLVAGNVLATAVQSDRTSQRSPQPMAAVRSQAASDAPSQPGTAPWYAGAVSLPSRLRCRRCVSDRAT